MSRWSIWRGGRATARKQKGIEDIGTLDGSMLKLHSSGGGRAAPDRAVDLGSKQAQRIRDDKIGWHGMVIRTHEPCTSQHSIPYTLTISQGIEMTPYAANMWTTFLCRQAGKENEATDTFGDGEIDKAYH